MKLNNEESRSIYDRLSAGWVRGELKGVRGIPRSRADLPGAEKLALEAGATGKSKRATSVFYPEGYDTEIKEADKAYAAVNAAFKKFTASDGLYSAHQELSDPLLLKLKPYLDDLEAKKAALITRLPTIIQNIYQNNARGADFRWEDYPDQATLDKSYTVQLFYPLRVGASNPVVCTPEMAEQIELAMERNAERQVQEAQQAAYKKLLDYLKPIVTQLTARAAHDDGSNKQNKAPKVSESLFNNIRQALEFTRQFALPGTPGGEALLNLTKEIEFKLELDIREVEDFKDNPPLARAVAQDAQAILEAMESLPGFE